MLCVLFSVCFDRLNSVSNVRKLSKQLGDEYYDADFAAGLYRSSSSQSFPSMFVALVSMDLRVWLNLLTRLDSTAKALAVTNLRRKNTISNTCYHWYPFYFKDCVWTIWHNVTVQFSVPCITHMEHVQTALQSRLSRCCQDTVQ